MLLPGIFNKNIGDIKFSQLTWTWLYFVKRGEEYSKCNINTITIWLLFSPQLVQKIIYYKRCKSWSLSLKLKQFLFILREKMYKWTKKKKKLKITRHFQDHRLCNLINYSILCACVCIFVPFKLFPFTSISNLASLNINSYSCYIHWIVPLSWYTDSSLCLPLTEKYGLNLDKYRHNL